MWGVCGVVATCDFLCSGASVFMVGVSVIESPHGILPPWHTSPQLTSHKYISAYVLYCMQDMHLVARHVSAGIKLAF